MSGEWIKMRTSLLTNPKVNGIARILEESSEVGRVLSSGFNGPLREIVTRNVTRHVTVSSLLVVWGAANEHTKDGIFENADLSDIDDMVSIPGFGAALVEVGWAMYDEENQRVIFPNFSEYNTSGSERSANGKTGAQRQKEYRDRQKAGLSDESDVTRDGKSDVTRDRREEKKREEKPKAPAEPLPRWIPIEAWEAFIGMRKQIKKPLTVDAFPLAIRKLDKLRVAGHDPKAVLEQSTLNSWQGLFELKPGEQAATAPRVKDWE